MQTKIRLGVATVLVGALMAAAPAPKFIDGYTIVMKMTTSASTSANSGTFKVAGDKMRIEMDMAGMGRGGRGAEAAAGAYMIFQPGGKIAAYVPAMNMAVALDASSIMGGGGRGRGMGAPPPAPTDVSVTVDDLGAGEAIAGHATHKYRVHSKFTLNGAVKDQTTDLWMANDFAGAEAAFAKFGSFASGAGGVQVGEEMVKKMPRGMPMKVVSTSDQGTNTMEVTDIKKTSFADSDFELPPGVQVMDLGAMMGGRRGGGQY